MTAKNKQPFGEVIASSLDTCTIQAWNWELYPSYGSLITLEETESSTRAIVTHINTAPLDGARMPTAYKKTDAELKAEFPHIFALLRTTITATTLGTQTEHREITAPLKPSRIHSFSFLESITNITHTEHMHYIRRILMLHEPQSADTLIQHYLQYTQKRGLLAGDCLHVLVSTYIEEVGNDYKRIFNFNRILQTLG